VPSGEKVTPGAVEAMSDACRRVTQSEMLTAILTVWFVKAIGNDGQRSRVRVQAVYLRWQSRARTECLEVAVVWIGKVQLAVAGVDCHVVETGELSAVEVVGEDCR